MNTKLVTLERKLKSLKGLYEVLLDNPSKTLQYRITASRLLKDMASVEKQLAELKLKEAFQ